MFRYVIVLAFACVSLVAGAAKAAGPSDLPLICEDDFENGADRWQPTDANAWKIADSQDAGRGKVYSQYQGSKYKPPHRSPLNVSLLKDADVGDFVLTVKVQSTCRDYGHRDACLFFGCQDPAHFYYVHLGKSPDPHSSQIMIVNGADRVMITKNDSPGIPWDDKWHEVKVVRRVADGTIEVYFDDMDKPVMVAVDKTLDHGRIGLGTFDDTANFDDVRLCGTKAEKK